MSEASLPDTGVIVYTSPDCVACKMTKRELDKHGAVYAVVDLSEHPDLVAKFKAEGLRAAPIVEAEGQRFAGFRPDRIKAMVAAAQPASMASHRTQSTTPDEQPPALNQAAAQVSREMR